MIDAPATTHTGFARRFEFWLPGLIVLCDQVTKAIIRRTLPLHAGGFDFLRQLLDFLCLIVAFAEFLLNRLHLLDRKSVV